MKQDGGLTRWVRARKWRENRDFERAWAEFESIREELLAEPHPDRAELARAEYELAFIASLRGESEQAAALFRQSGANAAAAGDQVGDVVGRFRAALTEYLGEIRSAADVHPEFVDLRRELEGARPRPGREIFHSNWRLNIDNRLFEITFEIAWQSGDQEAAADAERRFEIVSGHESLQGGGANIDLAILSRCLNGRRFMLTGKWEDAALAFSSFMPVDVGRPQDPKLVAAATARAELAREYRDLGHSLWLLGDEEAALRVWRQGLECPDEMGNRRFLSDLQALVSRAEDGSLHSTKKFHPNRQEARRTGRGRG